MTSLFNSVAKNCPWVAESADAAASPAALATQVVKRMTLKQKLSFVIMVAKDGYENINSGIPSLCIPPLTLSDGPNGLAGRVKGVTQLPAAIGLAASFDPSVLRQTVR